MKLNKLFENSSPDIVTDKVYRKQEAVDVIKKLHGKMFSVMYSDTALWFVSDLPVNLSVAQFDQLMKKSFSEKYYNVMMDMQLYRAEDAMQYLQLVQKYKIDPHVFIQNWKQQTKEDIVWVDESFQDDFEDDT